MTNPKLTQEDLDSMSDDALATISEGWKDEAKRFRDGAGLAQFELERRLEENGATKLETESWTGALESKGYTHTVEDDGALNAALLLAGVSTEKMDAEVWVIPPQPSRRWDMRALNEMHKLGGKIAKAIDQYRRSTPNRKMLVLKAKGLPPEVKAAP